LPLSEGERQLFYQVAEREPPSEPVNQIWLMSGRGSGKTSTAADATAYSAVKRDWRRVLAAGEFAVCLCLAADRDQARIALDRVKGLFRQSSILRQMVVRETTWGLELNNQAKIEIGTCNFRSIRGRSFACVALDEVGFWRNEMSQNPDLEVYTAVLPGLARVPGSLLIATSTPHSRAGLLWEMHQRYYGQESEDVIFVAGSTELFNPTLDPAAIAAARAADPAGAVAEWDARFRSDLESFIAREAAEALVVPGRYELPPTEGITYVGAVDPSGGSQDAMTCAVSHNDPQSGRSVLDAIRVRRPPFSPEQVTQEFAKFLRFYNVHEVVGDNYAGAWVREMFSKFGISYRRCELPKSEVYKSVLPYLMGGAIELLDNPHLLAELVGLERSVAKGGKDRVDHPPRGRDDIVNSVCIALGESIAPAWNPREEDFWVDDSTVAAKVGDALAEGYSHAEARMIAGRISPWSEDRRAPSRPGPFIV